VKSRIIESWESQDEPEHLRTIQARILRDEQRAGYLLELYQQIRLMEEKSEITADDTLEQSELQLSGLVVRQQNKLRVYNPIYQEISSTYCPLLPMAKSCYPNDFVSLALPVVDIFDKIRDIWQRILPKFSPVVKTPDAIE
jgi:hypothetical protein